MRILVFLGVTMGLAGFLSQPAFGQTYPVDRGVWEIAGSAAATYSDDERVDADGFWHVHLTPNVSYFLMPGVSIGGVVGVSYSNQGAGHRWGIVVGPQVAYHFGRRLQAWYPFVRMGLGYTTTAVRRQDQSNTTDRFAVQLEAGTVLMLSRTVALRGEGFISSEKLENGSFSLAGYRVGWRMGLAFFLF